MKKTEKRKKPENPGIQQKLKLSEISGLIHFPLRHR
jgi:hypothetical protein